MNVPPTETRREKLPPELASAEDLADVYVAGIRCATKRLRYRPYAIAREVVNAAALKLMTTHRWDSTKGPLLTWFVLLVLNEIKELTREAASGDAEVEAQYRNYEREERMTAAMNPEDVMIERQDRAEHERKIPELLAQTRLVEELVSEHPVAVAMIAEWKANGCDLKPQQLAARLRVDVDEIYKAIKVIKYHAQCVRERLAKEGKES